MLVCIKLINFFNYLIEYFVSIGAKTNEFEKILEQMNSTTNMST